MKRLPRDFWYRLQWYANRVLRAVYGTAMVLLGIGVMLCMASDPPRDRTAAQIAASERLLGQLFVGWLIALVGFATTRLWLKHNPRR